MEKENRIAEHHRILEKFFNSEPLNYYETLVVFAVICSIGSYLLKKFNELSLESEVND